MASEEHFFPQLKRSFYAFCVVKSETAFIHGGAEVYQSTEKPFGDVVLFNLATNSVADVIKGGPSRSHHTAVALNDMTVCIVGGWDGKKRSSDVFLFNLIDLSWVKLKQAKGSATPAGLSGHMCSLISHDEMIVTGREGGVRMQRKYGSVFKLKINLKSNSYSYAELPQHIASRSGHTCSLMNLGTKQILVLYGGRDSDQADVIDGIKITTRNKHSEDIAEIFNEKTLGTTWKPCKAPKIRFHASVGMGKYEIVHGGEVFGRARDTVSADLRIYDAACGDWYEMGGSNHSVDLHRMGHAVAYKDGKLFIFGGIGKNGKHSIGSVITVKLA